MKFNARRVSLFDRFIFQPGKRGGKSSPASNASRSRQGAREHVENLERVEIISDADPAATRTLHFLHR